jgi:hypothetical protein
MRKPAFYGLAAFSGACAVFCAHEAQQALLPGAKVSRVESDFLAIGNELKAYMIEKGLRPAAVQEADEKMESHPSY